MKFGITTFPTDRALNPIRLGMLVEQHGFESLFLPEHTHVPVDRSSPFPGGGELPEDFYRFHDPLECLSAIAAVTTRLVLGTGTLVLPSHDPIFLAKRVATLDHLSGGRVVLGVGAGWNLQEIANHGRDPAKRWVLLAELIEALKLAWTQETVAFSGQAVHLAPMHQWPKPLQKPHPPILLGGSGPTVERRVLDMADGWIASGRHLDGEVLGARIANLRLLEAGEGRSPVPVTLQQATPSVDAIERYLKMGLERVTFRVDPGDQESVASQLERLAALVGPYL